MRRYMFLMIFGVAGLAVLLALGFWQLQRLAVKQEIIRQIDTRVGAVPVDLADTPDPVRDKYLAVGVSGAMLTGEIHVLVSREVVGVGYRVIAPFELDDGRRILVDRGFTPARNKTATRVIGDMAVTGNLHWPDETDGFTPEPELATNIWFAREVTAMARALDTEPVLLIANVASDPTVTPWPVDSSAIPNAHLQYAITWFLLALVWLAMTIYFMWRTRANAESPKL